MVEIIPPTMDLYTNTDYALPAIPTSYESVTARIVPQTLQREPTSSLNNSSIDSLLLFEYLLAEMRQQLFSACVEQASYEREQGIPRTLYVTNEDVFMIGPTQHVGMMRVGAHKQKGVPRDSIDMGCVAMFKKGFDSLSPATYLEGELRVREEEFFDLLTQQQEPSSSSSYLDRAA